MRASNQEGTGTAGLSDVQANFERIDWAPVRNAEHDLGTDLLVAARDLRRFDRGVVLGVQVKAGSTPFENPEYEDGTLLGWWYYEAKADHFDDWVAHGMPHLLVFHDLGTRVSYWAHVTAERCHGTGRGCKILVPADQRIDEAHREALLDVAATHKAAAKLEGTAFKASASAVPPARRLRFAMMAPRLVAPHPNAGHSRPIDPEEAVALIIQGRLRDLEMFAEEHTTIPDPSSDEGSADWRWRYVHAVWQWLVDDSVTVLEERTADAPNAQARTAAAIAVACFYINTERHDDAVSWLGDQIEIDDQSPVDLAWLLVQRGRARMEVGDVEGARCDAVAAQRELVGDPDDVTVSVLAGSSAWQLFATSDLESEAFGKAMTSSDTAISWWRAQTTSSALSQASLESFRQWADDRTTRWSAEDRLRNSLVAAAMNATLVGEHGAWRSSMGRLAQHDVRAAHASNQGGLLVDALDALRRAGDGKSLELAGMRLWNIGPVVAVTQAADRIPLERMCHTTSKAALELWKALGDVVAPSTANSAADWCLNTLADEDSFNERTRPTFWVQLALIEALNGLLPATDNEIQARAVHFLAARQSDDPLINDHFGRALSRVRIDTVGGNNRDLLRRAIAARTDSRLIASMLAALSRSGDEEARSTLSMRAATGDLHSLGAIEDITVLDEQTAATLISMFEDRATHLIAEAATGRFSFGRWDPSRAIVFLNGWFPNVARWDVVLDLLASATVPAEFKRSTCLSLITFADGLGEDIRRSVSEVIASLQASGHRSTLGLESLGGLPTTLAIAVGAVDDAAAEAAVAALLARGPDHRRDATVLLGHGRASSLRAALAGLVADAQIEVRAAAAEAVGRLAAKGDDSPMIVSVMRAIVADSGARLPNRLLVGATGNDGMPSWMRELTEPLHDHPSAFVRAALARAGS